MEKYTLAGHDRSRWTEFKRTLAAGLRVELDADVARYLGATGGPTTRDLGGLRVRLWAEGGRHWAERLGR